MRHHLCSLLLYVHVVELSANNVHLIFLIFFNCKFDGSCKAVGARALLRKLRSGFDVHGRDAAAPNAAMPMSVLFVSLHHAQCHTDALYDEKQNRDETQRHHYLCGYTIVSL